jgi:hypothetical protein
MSSSNGKVIEKSLIAQKTSIEEVLYMMSINQFKIYDDLTVDIDETVDLTNHNLMTLPFQFGVIDGDFICNNNLLKDLHNAPKEVKGTFSCEYNLLTTLEGAPKEVGSNFIFTGNKVSSFKHLPLKIKGNIVANSNLITSIDELNCECDGYLISHKNPVNGKMIKELLEYYDENEFLVVSFDVIKSLKEKEHMEAFLKENNIIHKNKL